MTDVTLYLAPVTSLAEFTTTVIEAALTRPRWFRGINDASHKLVPSLYRHPTIADVDKLLSIESSLLVRFKQRSVPFMTLGPQRTDWDYFFLMQHYGVPTRLLDWSENAFVALWFALHGQAPTIQLTDAVVWVLDPIAWNRRVFEFQSYEGGVFSPGDAQLTGYLQNSDAPMNKAPVAIYGTHNSPRIVAQRGTFTIAGHNATSLSDAVEIKNDELMGVLIPGPERPRMLAELRAAGFAESMIFPDLEGLAREIKLIEGFSA